MDSKLPPPVVVDIIQMLDLIRFREIESFDDLQDRTYCKKFPGDTKGR